MITVEDLKTWVCGLDPFGHVGIADGLTLVEIREDDSLPRDYLAVGGYDKNSDPTRESSTILHTPTVSAPAGAVVASVANLSATGGTCPMRAELPRLREAIRNSSLAASLGDVVYSIVTARRGELTARLRAFTHLDEFTGRLGRSTLSAVPHPTIADLFTEIESATGLSLMRVCCGEAARVCVQDRDTGRLFDLDHDFELWLHGDLPAPGPVAQWIGEPVEDFTRDELLPSGPHDYQLAELPADHGVTTLLSPATSTSHRGRPAGRTVVRRPRPTERRTRVIDTFAWTAHPTRDGDTELALIAAAPTSTPDDLAATVAAQPLPVWTRHRVRAALLNSDAGYPDDPYRLYRVGGSGHGSHHDLAAAVAIHQLTAEPPWRPLLDQVLFLTEISLDGRLRSTLPPEALTRAIAAAQRAEFRYLVTARPENTDELDRLEKITVITPSDLHGVLGWLDWLARHQPTTTATAPRAPWAGLAHQIGPHDADRLGAVLTGSAPADLPVLTYRDDSPDP
ncbi:magnesium chelatase domain-containing protein [Nocardia takedensis]